MPILQGYFSCRARVCTHHHTAPRGHAAYCPIPMPPLSSQLSNIDDTPHAHPTSVLRKEQGKRRIEIVEQSVSPADIRRPVRSALPFGERTTSMFQTPNPFTHKEPLRWEAVNHESVHALPLPRQLTSHTKQWLSVGKMS